MATKNIVILGNGGTIAGQTASSDNNIDYTAAQLGVNLLVTVVPGSAESADLQYGQVALIDSLGDVGAVWLFQQNTFKLKLNWPLALVNKAQAAPEKIARLNCTGVWPKVETVMYYAGASGEIVDALVALDAAGLVVAGTGNSSVHHALEAVLLKGRARGVQFVRATRCKVGPVRARRNDGLPASYQSSPVKTRIKLMLALMDIAT